MDLQNWITFNCSTDIEANYYRLFIFLKEINKIAKTDYVSAQKMCNNALVDFTLAYLTFFTNYDKLRHIKTGIYALSIFMYKLNKEKKDIDLIKLCNTEIYKKI